VVRRHKPEIVITLNFEHRCCRGSFNTADHFASGGATMDAVRHTGNRWIFPEPISDEVMDEWDGVRAVWVGGSPGPWRTVGIPDTLETAVESLATPKKYTNRAGRQQVEPAEFLQGPARLTETWLSVAVAVGFEIYGLGGG
jgi:LmbE family N-acetylglucosaminyl deacetylase